MMKISDSPDLMWKSAKSFMGWASQGSPQQLQVGNELITSAKEIAHSMNNYFVTKVSSIRACMGEKDFPICKLKDFMRNKDCRLQLRHVSLERIRKIIRSLSNSKSIGIDELDSYSLKVAADFVVYPIHHIVCLSIIQQKFPDSWKFSKVIPLHKKGEVLERKNYRPVAILSPLSKVLEKIVFEQVYNYFTKFNLFHSSLHGYRKNRSTQTALLQVYDRWVRASHEGKLSGVVLLDLSAAFDLVDSDLLLRKLQLYGFESDILTWMKSYLTNRFQAIWIDHVLSEFAHCEVGVPQGSILGPLLFLIFFNDLPLSVNCSLDAYADDSSMTVSGKSIEEISNTLTECCKTVSDWMLGNKLKLNADKTHLLTFGTSSRLKMQESSVVVHMDGIRLNESTDRNELLLGCYVESTLKWHKQIDYSMGKLQVWLGALRKLGNKLPFDLRNRIAGGVFTSVLTYCLPVFGGCGKTDLDALQVMQNSAARYVSQSGKDVPRKVIFGKTGWLTVRQLVYYHTVLCIFRIRSSQEPEYLSEILTRDNRRNKIIVPNSNLTLARKSFCFRGAEDWNRLPEEIRTCSQIQTFKAKLKSWTLENISQFDEN